MKDTFITNLKRYFAADWSNVVSCPDSLSKYTKRGRGEERESGKFHRSVSFMLSTIFQDSEQGVKPHFGALDAGIMYYVTTLNALALASSLGSLLTHTIDRTFIASEMQWCPAYCYRREPISLE